MNNKQLARIGMFSGLPMDGSDTPLQVSTSNFQATQIQNITPVNGSDNDTAIDPEEVIVTPNPFAGLQDDSLSDSVAQIPVFTPVSNEGNADTGGDTAPSEEPDPVPDGSSESEGEEYELVKDKPRKGRTERNKMVRLVLLALGVLVAYRLFFGRRR